jgi:hypothetical protein
MKMTFGKNQFLTPEIGRPEPPPTDEQESRLNVIVVFTSVTATITALKKAGSWAESLTARVTLLVPQIVPYPLPLTDPPVSLEFQEKRFREMAAETPTEIQVQLCLCRDTLETLKQVLKPRSLIVIGGRNRLWPTREKGLVRKLRRAGHEVIFTESR